MSAAADRLHFSPSAIAASISELERTLDAELCVRRRAQGVTVTPTGAVVLARAKQLLDDVSELHYAVRGGADQLVGPLVLGCYTTLAPIVLPRALEEFERLHPAVTVDFVVGAQDELRAALRDGRIDAAILYDMGETPELHRHELFRSRGYALFGKNHPLAGTHAPITIEELAPLPLILFDQTPSTRYVTDMFDEHGLTPNIRHRTHAFELTRSIIARSDNAYAILVQRPVNTQSYEGLPIVEREITPAAPAVSVVFAHPRDTRLSARADAMASLLQHQYAPGIPKFF